jgi:CRP-like cAMP-binding protein
MELLADNALLRVAAKAKRPDLIRKLKHVHFDPGRLLWTEHQPLPYALFPLRGVLSLQVSPAPGRRVQIAMAGREGFAGISLAIGTAHAIMAAVALTEGEGLAMPPDVFRTFSGIPSFQSAVKEYLQTFLVMLSKLSLCSRVHVFEKLCVGHLLLLQDRTETDSFSITHDSLSRLLGVRRASVSRTAARLQKLGAIRYNRRGQLIIADRGELEKVACSCYRAIHGEFAGLDRI